MTKRLAELLSLSMFLLIAILLYKSTMNFPEVVQNSTAAYVRFLAICFGGLCLLAILLRLKSKSTEENKKLDLAAAPVRFWSLLILMFVYSLLLEPLGFYLASALFLPVTMVVLGARKKILIALTAVGVLLFVYIVFAKLLGVPLPESSLF
ncbi:MAG: tripartite tricarboxylate transporter TctB family protein [Deltaproteobacteria bacterium]|nr:tripartite tricarboxylate transporter TctB family protein [Deltaproteobacteria bacterium]